jgi:hypothetical protein
VSAVEWTPEQAALRDRILGDAAAEGERWCNSCSTSKPLDQFPRDRSDRSGRGYRCGVCNRNQPQLKARTRANSRLVEAHRAEYDALYAEELAKIRSGEMAQ